MQTREETLDYLKAARAKIVSQMEALDKKIEHLNATIDLVQKEIVYESASPIPEPPEFPIGKLRKLTQIQAVVAIAKHYGGIVKAQDAKRLMIRANVMRETKNSTNITHNVIIRSGKFERIGPGEYRLKEFLHAIADNDSAFRPLQ